MQYIKTFIYASLRCNCLHICSSHRPSVTLRGPREKKYPFRHQVKNTWNSLYKEIAYEMVKLFIVAHAHRHEIVVASEPFRVQRFA